MNNRRTHVLKNRIRCPSSSKKHLLFPNLFKVPVNHKQDVPSQSSRSDQSHELSILSGLGTSQNAERILKEIVISQSPSPVVRLISMIYLLSNLDPGSDARKTRNSYFNYRYMDETPDISFEEMQKNISENLDEDLYNSYLGSVSSKDIEKIFIRNPIKIPSDNGSFENYIDDLVNGLINEITVYYFLEDESRLKTITGMTNIPFQNLKEMTYLLADIILYRHMGSDITYDRKFLRKLYDFIKSDAKQLAEIIDEFSKNNSSSSFPGYMSHIIQRMKNDPSEDISIPNQNHNEGVSISTFHEVKPVSPTISEGTINQKSLSRLNLVSKIKELQNKLKINYPSSSSIPSSNETVMENEPHVSEIIDGSVNIIDLDDVISNELDDTSLIDDHDFKDYDSQYDDYDVSND